MKPHVLDHRYDFRGGRKCECGCGSFAGFATRTGKPKRYIHGHNGTRILEQNRTKIRQSNLQRSLVSNPPSLIPEGQDLAWAAGIFEGEGSVWARRSIKRNGDSAYSLRVQVAQKDNELLHRLKAYFGGSIVPHSQRDGVSLWSLTSHVRSKQFMQTIRPWLTSRRISQLEKALVQCG